MNDGADADPPAPEEDRGGAGTAPPRGRAHRAAALLARALGRPAAPARYDGTELTPRHLVRAFSRRSRELAMQRLGKLACFRADDYVQTYSDIRRAGMDPRFHALFVGGFEERRLFRPETLAKCLGAPLPAPPPGAMPPPHPLRVGVYVSSLGNIFMREIAEDVAAGLRVAGATVDVLDETSPIGGRPPCCVFVAPHEYFHLGGGAAWVREDVVANALMLNTEQPQTRWFGRALPFLLASRGVIELCPQAAALFAGADMPSLLVAPAPNPVPLTDDDRRHPLFRVLPAGARAPASALTAFGERAIDVAFFGTESRHREDWFSRHAGALADFDCVIHYRREDRGPIRAGSADAALTRLAQHVGGHAKIVLNLHRDAFGYLEWHRIVRQGLLQGAVVVSEPCLPHPLLLPDEHYFEAPARQIPPLIGWLVRSEDGRQAAARMQANVRALLADVVTPAATGAKIVAFLYAHAPAMMPRIAADVVLDTGAQGAMPGDLVSVAVSLFNYARFLPECLGSVAAQRHRALELIVVDDASDQDDSVQAAQSWLAAHAERFFRVTLLRHSANQGLAQTRNTAFEHASGDCVFVLDADNALYPRAIGRLHALLRAEPFAAAYTQLEYFGAEQRIGPADVWRRENFARRNYVDAMALVRASAWRQLGGYTHIEGGWEDYDFWCKFIEHGLEAAYVPEVLCRYRVHEQSMLRTETRARKLDLRVRLTLRHPWLEM